MAPSFMNIAPCRIQSNGIKLLVWVMDTIALHLPALFAGQGLGPNLQLTTLPLSPLLVCPLTVNLWRRPQPGLDSIDDPAVELVLLGLLAAVVVRRSARRRPPITSASAAAERRTWRASDVCAQVGRDVYLFWGLLLLALFRAGGVGAGGCR